MQPLQPQTNPLDAETTRLAESILPRLSEALARNRPLELRYNRGKYEKLLIALTEKLPAQLNALPLDVDERNKILLLIDGLTRDTWRRGKDAAFKELMLALFVIQDILGSAIEYLDLRIYEEGEEVTNAVLGNLLR